MNPETQQTMQVAEISAFGGPEVLKTAHRPRPQPGPGEVLIRVVAAGINRPDLLQRQGKYPPPPGASDIPGLEVAGDIVASRDPAWQVGDKVCALLTGGGYAEYAVAPAGQCLPVPINLSMIEAAALPEGIFTIWNNLFHRGRLKAGETVLIHGGSSGIGTLAIQMAENWGAKVIITAGTDKKCDFCRQLGADLAINYKNSDFVAVIEAQYGPKSVNIVLDMVGGDYIPRNIQLLSPEGRHISIAVQGGSKAEIDIAQIMTKRLALTGSTLRPRSIEEKTALAQAIKQYIWPLIEAGHLKPVIYQTFPLNQAALAHAALEKGDHIGKIVLTVA